MSEMSEYKLEHSLPIERMFESEMSDSIPRMLLSGLYRCAHYVRIVLLKLGVYHTQQTIL